MFIIGQLQYVVTQKGILAAFQIWPSLSAVNGNEIDKNLCIGNIACNLINIIRISVSTFYKWSYEYLCLFSGTIHYLPRAE